MKKLRTHFTPSEILDPVLFEGYEIQNLKHGNTEHILYRFPSKEHDWEGCWTMDLNTAQKGVMKYKKYLIEGDTETVVLSV